MVRVEESSSQERDGSWNDNNLTVAIQSDHCHVMPKEALMAET